MEGDVWRLFRGRGPKTISGFGGWPAQGFSTEPWPMGQLSGTLYVDLENPNAFPLSVGLVAGGCCVAQSCGNSSASASSVNPVQAAAGQTVRYWSPSLKPIGRTWSYSTCRIKNFDSVWLP
jgi:hypothetical protein